MIHVRATARLLLIVSMTLAMYVCWVLGIVVLLPFPRRRMALRRFIVRSWSKWTLRIVGFHIKVIGRPPSPPFCLVANHLSYVDALLMMTCVDGVLVSRADVRHWPVFGHLAWMSGTLFINRSLARDVMRVNRMIEQAFKRGDGVVFFPEGTSTRGIDVGTFRSPLLAVPAEQGVPVHYASISYQTRPPDPAASQSVCWWGEMTFIDHLYRLLTLKSCTARVHFGERPLSHPDRKQLARQLRDNIVSNFVPVTQDKDL